MTQKHALIHTFPAETLTHPQACITPEHIHILTHRHTLTPAHKDISEACIHTYTSMCTGARVGTLIPTHSHRHTHEHIHWHTQSCYPDPLPGMSLILSLSRRDNLNLEKNLLTKIMNAFLQSCKFGERSKSLTMEN